MRVTYSPRALAQLEALFDYIAAEDRATATAVVARIARLVSLLGNHPYLGRPTDKVGVHLLTVPRYPYVVFYKILPDTDEVRILRVRHTAQRPLKNYR